MGCSISSIGIPESEELKPNMKKKKHKKKKDVNHHEALMGKDIPRVPAINF
jgi:hypothetical protein